MDEALQARRRRNRGKVAMNKWIMSACFSTFFIALTAAPAAAVDVRLESYRNPKNENFRIFNHMYLDGVRGGLMASNAWLKRHGGQMLFCMPGDLALSSEQVEEIMLKSADKRSAKGDMAIALLLLWGMQDTYPCEKAGGEKSDSQ
ncbi:hypothetical protein [Bradyrhizobium sp. USDA 4451]